MGRNERTSEGDAIRGVEVDGQGRCAHWRLDVDIVSFRFPCCPGWWACRECHDAVAGHPAERWSPADFDTEAVRCGACDARLSIAAYLKSPGACPRCTAPFNPRCVRHHPRYFRTEPAD